MCVLKTVIYGRRNAAIVFASLVSQVCSFITDKVTQMFDFVGSRYGQVFEILNDGSKL